MSNLKQMHNRKKQIYTRMNGHVWTISSILNGSSDAI